jgi:sn-glycerol 3-phosphate transport system permease protein
VTDAAATGSALAGRFDVESPSDAPESGSAASQSPLSPTRKRSWREVPTALVMLLPSMVLLGTFVLYPLVRAVFYGRQRCDALGNHCTTNGWHQYVDVFRSSEFQHAIGVSFKFVFMTVPIGLVLGVALAILADKQLRGIGMFRTAFSSTVATSVAVASLMWFFLLQPDTGALANIGWLNHLFPVIKDPGLLRDPGTALWSTAITSIWANLGFTFILVMAGLQGIPRDLYESAFVDGAGGWTRFTNVTLPLLSPTLLFTTVVLTSRAFQSYGEFDLLTNGGPYPQASTTPLTYLTYGGASPIKGDLGLQSATAVLLFLVLLLLSLVQFAGFGRRVHYGG